MKIKSALFLLSLLVMCISIQECKFSSSFLSLSSRETKTNVSGLVDKNGNASVKKSSETASTKTKSTKKNKTNASPKTTTSKKTESTKKNKTNASAKTSTPKKTESTKKTTSKKTKSKAVTKKSNTKAETKKAETKASTKKAETKASAKKTTKKALKNISKLSKNNESKLSSNKVTNISASSQKSAASQSVAHTGPLTRADCNEFLNAITDALGLVDCLVKSFKAHIELLKKWSSKKVPYKLFNNGKNIKVINSEYIIAAKNIEKKFSGVEVDRVNMCLNAAQIKIKLSFLRKKLEEFKDMAHESRQVEHSTSLVETSNMNILAKFK